jgi:hypothetical protein
MPTLLPLCSMHIESCLSAVGSVSSAQKEMIDGERMERERHVINKTSNPEDEQAKQD